MDFYEHISDIQHILHQGYYLWDISRDGAVDLGVRDVRCDTIEELRHILEKAPICYTKNTQTIERFIHDNDLPTPDIRKISRISGESFEVDDIQVICDDIFSHMFVKRRRKKHTV